MSTKTTFKRVALVAVATLGLGVLSVVPSSATVNADSLVVSSATATQTTAETATATSATATLQFLGAALDSMSVTASLVSGPATSTALPYLQLAETASATIDTKTAVQWTNSAVGFGTGPNTASVVTNASGAVAQTSAKWKVYLSTNGTAAPSVAGTYVVKLTPANVSTGSLNGSAQTITITVSKSTADIATGGTVILNRGETNTATTDAVVTASKEAATTPDAAATLVVALKNSAAGTPTESYTASITGPGTLGGVALSNISSSNNSLGRAISVKFDHVVQVFADGSSGVATVTISTASGVVIGTKSITFYGDASTITAKTTALTTGTVAKIGSNAKLISFTVADAAGTTVNTGSYYLVSAAAATISNTYTACNAWNATDGYTCDVAGVAKGTTNVYVTNKPSATDTTVTTVIKSADVAVRVGTTTPASVSVALDKSAYAPGEKATLTVTLKDADGNVVPSGDYTGIFATGGIAPSYLLTGDTTTATGLLAAVDGVKTYTLYMPNTEGSVDFKWTTGSTTAGALAGLALANQAKAGIITVDVSSTGSAAALDAANEATDAANAATDAALAAADAADAATAAAEDASAAVATLAKSVNTALGNLKKQITALTALVNKLLKK
ncbi:DUF262 domain-containing protein [Candidatus Planktophila versatilis]|uniref:DUF262 domain-containing protein n=1 Tax=Candidatus Planktophila versatilis TaxID=1884905 RepID=A0AAD0E686_9ACTN|nr:hypothetical protein [Candidatus Planktophila versatilis]ASY22062.1 DUF262 domain-containing protein [Candidatus Planktophila versatilis]